MFENFLILKKEIGKLNVTLKNSLGPTCEKLTHTPRILNTAQIKSATENILLTHSENQTLPEITTRSAEYILKDFFLYMHQTGLYNRQLKLWKALANITEIKFFRIQEGFFKKKELNIYIAHMLIDPKVPSICIIIDETRDNPYENLRSLISKTTNSLASKRLKGIFYLSNKDPGSNVIKKLESITDITHPISRYESVLENTEDTRLNVINYTKANGNMTFSHIYPELKSLKQ